MCSWHRGIKTWPRQPLLAPPTPTHTSQDRWLTSSLSFPPEFTFYTGNHVETIAPCQGWCTQTLREETQVSSVNCLACPSLQTAFSRDRVAK